MKKFIGHWFTLLFVGSFHLGTGQVPSGSADDSSGEVSTQAESKIYFKANGVDPVWTLTISPTRIEFKTEATGFQTFNAPHVEPIKAMDSNVKLYRLQTEAGKMEVELTSMSCQNNNSRERFPYTVNISLQQGTDTTYSYFNGCGKYITDPGIEGMWILQSIGSDKVHAGQFNDTLPYVVLHARGTSFEGYDGCNTIKGRIFSERSLLRFTNLILTKRVCATMAKEAAFVKALEFSTEHLIKDNKLVLSNPGGVTMVFLKSTE